MLAPQLHAVLAVGAVGVVRLAARPIREDHGFEGPEPHKVTLFEHIRGSDPHSSSGCQTHAAKRHVTTRHAAH